MWKCFPEEHAKSAVSPLERLIACWSHVAFAEKESPAVLNDDMKRDKKDIEVIQRLRMLQAMFISSSQGNYFMQTGDETTKRVNEEIASRGRSADKMDAYLQRREKERKQKEEEKRGPNNRQAPQNPQSTGKQSTMKDDGLNKEFQGDESSSD